jgi:hypothetical protein
MQRALDELEDDDGIIDLVVCCENGGRFCNDRESCFNIVLELTP